MRDRVLTSPRSYLRKEGLRCGRRAGVLHLAVQQRLLLDLEDQLGQILLLKTGPFAKGTLVGSVH